MKRIIVIGCPGSGKSTFSRELHRLTGLPLTHLDNLNWNPDGTTVDKEVFRRRLFEVLRENEWIIDGNYGSTMEPRVLACDTVFFLDYPTDVCLQGVRDRKGKPRSDMPWKEADGETDAAFTDFIRSFASESRPGILELLKNHPEKTVFTFTNRCEADAYLKQYGEPSAAGGLTSSDACDTIQTDFRKEDPR